MGGVGTGVGEGAVAEVEEVVLEEVVEVVEEEVAVGLEARAQLRRQRVVEEEVEGFVGALAAGEDDVEGGGHWELRIEN